MILLNKVTRNIGPSRTKTSRKEYTALKANMLSYRSKNKNLMKSFSASIDKVYVLILKFSQMYLFVAFCKLVRENQL